MQKMPAGAPIRATSFNIMNSKQSNKLNNNYGKLVVDHAKDYESMLEAYQQGEDAK